jgi:trans-aconitate methyltransferase
VNSGQRLIELLAPQPGEQILDIGCGIGDLTARIAASGAQVTGLDHSAVLLEQARLRYPQITWLHADFLLAEPAPIYDAVFSHAALHWIGHYAEAALLLFDWLRPGGRIAVSLGGMTPALAMMEGDLPSASELEDILSAAGFDAVRVSSEPGLLLAAARCPQ